MFNMFKYLSHLGGGGDKSQIAQSNFWVGSVEMSVGNNIEKKTVIDFPARSGEYTQDGEATSTEKTSPSVRSFSVPSADQARCLSISCVLSLP